MNKVSAILLLVILSSAAFAAGGIERLYPLEANPHLLTQKSRQELIQRSQLQLRLSAISLPFFDDFYQSSPFPDPTKWIGNDVYINATYPISPPTIGVATFDGLKGDGTPHNPTINAIGFCDSLASQPFDLSGLNNADDVFLSFFFQSQGFGERPDAGIDFLRAEFLHPDGYWVEQWRGAADSVRPFRQVFLHVKDDFLYDGFQFRFVRYGRLSGNLDHFHIDYVRMDKDRDTIFDKNLTEMAYQYLPSGLLKRYYVMPYNQFDSTELSNQHSVQIRNNFVNFTTDIVDFWEAKEVATNTPLGNFNGPSRDFLALTDNPVSYEIFDIPTIFTDDEVTIRVDYHFDCSAEIGLPAAIQANNTVSKEQVFSNYFAYDDGSAELAYRLEDAPGAKVAVRYHLNKPDTLRAIKFHVANYNTNLSQALFSVLVWKGFGKNGEADTLLYREDFVKVSDLKKAAGDAVNDFSYYALNKEFILEEGLDELVLEGDFYMGFQLTNSGLLNFGFDVNTNGSDHHFVNFGSGWSKSLFQGSIMVNAVVGKALPWQLTPVKEQISNIPDVVAFPNPTKGKVFLKNLPQQASSVSVVDMLGRVVMERGSFGAFLDMGNLADGIYTVMFYDNQRYPVARSRVMLKR
jgi:hypothetical protein